VLQLRQFSTLIGFVMLGLAQSLPMLFLARAGRPVGRGGVLQPTINGLIRKRSGLLRPPFVSNRTNVV
jgi:hypothetical protein